MRVLVQRLEAVRPRDAQLGDDGRIISRANAGYVRVTFVSAGSIDDAEVDRLVAAMDDGRKVVEIQIGVVEDA